MNSIERFFLKRLIKKEVRQGYTHRLKIEILYLEIRDAVRSEFTEDNIPTSNAFLTDAFETALSK